MQGNVKFETSENSGEETLQSILKKKKKVAKKDIQVQPSIIGIANGQKEGMMFDQPV